MAYTIGSKVVGKGYVRIPDKMLDVTIPGFIYEIQILTDKPVPDPAVLADLIKTEFAKRLPEVKIYWISIDGDEVRIQLSASPVSWSVILALLPLIFALVGLTLILIAVWGIITAIPGWAWGCLILGVLTLIILPHVAKYFPAPPKKK
jgi:hypothetical protein